MSSRLFLVICEDCPPYDTITTSRAKLQSGHHTPRHAHGHIGAVNPVTDYTDNMWCRRGDTIVPGAVRTKGIRVDGIED